MQKLIFASILVLSFSSHASAGCVGTGSFSSCYDASGNSYTVNRMGNTTYTNGFNSNTGSSWSETSRTIGDTTYHSGFDADGDSWNVQQRRIGNSSYYSGFDSDGNHVSKTCNQFGCF